MFSRLYIHIPWCISKCGYCAFSSRPLQQHNLEQTCSLLCHEMELVAAQWPGNQPLQSVYLGGGTPSLLSAEQVATLLHHSCKLFGHAADVEITLEANPGTVSLESLIGYHQAGVTRLSLGVQSLDDQMLVRLGRIHSANDSQTALTAARQAGFSAIGMDLICGLPGQSLSDWQDTLQQVISLQLDHLSVYGLTIEEGTPFATRYPDGSTELPDDDQTAGMLEQADQLLTTAGFEHYEIANFARPGKRSRHNCGYWQRDGYLGIGPGAHSYLQQGWGLRFGNQSDYDAWADAIRDNRLARLDQQRLSREDALSETIFLGLRMTDGINLDHFADLFGERLEQRYASAITQLQQAGLLRYSTERLALTKRGMLLSNQVFVHFI